MPAVRAVAGFTLLPPMVLNSHHGGTPAWYFGGTTQGLNAHLCICPVGHPLALRISPLPAVRRMTDLGVAERGGQLPFSRACSFACVALQDLPLSTTYDGRTFEYQLGVSLYDEAYGTFYGNTVYSMSDAYDRGRAAQRNAIDLDFSFDVYYHTKVGMHVARLGVRLARLGVRLARLGQQCQGWACDALEEEAL
eukprot:360045-Chlamydomonas_euryale.AAC.13